MLSSSLVVLAGLVIASATACGGRDAGAAAGPAPPDGLHAVWSVEGDTTLPPSRDAFVFDGSEPTLGRRPLAPGQVVVLWRCVGNGQLHVVVTTIADVEAGLALEPSIRLPCPAGRDTGFQWRLMGGVVLGGENALAVMNVIAPAPAIRYEVVVAQFEP